MNSTNTNPQAQSNARNGTPPSHVAYHVREVGAGENKTSFWTRIGAAWSHRDGKGFNLQIDVVPLDGHITLRVADDKKD